MEVGGGGLKKEKEEDHGGAVGVGVRRRPVEM